MPERDPEPAGGVRALHLLGIFLLALFVRVAYLGELRDSALLAIPLGDAAYYHAWAERIANGDWAGSGAFYHAPGYAYFLGALYGVFGVEPEVARLVQAGLGALACVLLTSAAGRAFSSRVGIVSGLLLAIYAPAIYYGGLLQKPALALLLLTLFLDLLARYRARPRGWTLLGAGAVCGLAALTRENLIVLPVLALPAILSAGRQDGQGGLARRARDAGILVAGLMIALAPVFVRGRTQGVTQFALPANLGPNLYIGNSANADGLYVPLVPGRGVPGSEQVDAREIARRESGRALDDGEVSRFWAGLAIDWALAHPLDWTRLTLRKVQLLVSDREWMDSQSYVVYRAESRVLGVLGSFARFGSLFVLALLGLGLSWGRRRELASWYIGTAVVFAGILPFFVFGRLRFALVPFLLPFAARVLVEGRALRRSYAGRSLLLPGAVLAAGLVATFWPVGDRELPAATTWTNVASALEGAGRAEEARALLLRAVEAGPEYAGAHYNLGVHHAQAGEVDLARAAFLRAGELEPTYLVDAHLEMARAFLAAGDVASARGLLLQARNAGPPTAELHYQIGTLLSAAGLPGEAEAAYRDAIAGDPGFADAHNNLAWILATRGVYPEAIAGFERALAADPEHALALFNLGRLLAGNPDAVVRDGARALELAEAFRAQASEDDQGRALELVGMALSSLGRLEEAAAFADRAAGAYEARSLPEAAAAARGRAAGYRAGRPYRY